MTVFSTVVSRALRWDIDHKWELSQILPYRSAKRGLTAGISAAHCLKTPAWPLTAPAGLREIIHDLI
jgi:hypothetical protein